MECYNFKDQVVHKFLYFLLSPQFLESVFQDQSKANHEFFLGALGRVGVGGFLTEIDFGFSEELCEGVRFEWDA